LLGFFVFVPLDGIAADGFVCRHVSDLNAAHFVPRDFQPVQLRQLCTVKPDTVNFPLAQFDYPAFRFVLELHPQTPCPIQLLAFYGFIFQG